ncbi:MAG: PAS domain S-box protein [Candidatus Nitrosoglobus sp.]
MSEPIHFDSEWCRVTLASIADGMITVDIDSRITFLNPAAEAMTGWTLKEVIGFPLEKVFHIINEESRQLVVSPAMRALRESVVVNLVNHALLIAKDGTECPIDDSAAPIRNDKGEVVGVVLVFRNVSECRKQEHRLKSALDYAESIIATVREPLIILDKSLRVQTANASFYRHFHVAKEDTEGHFIYELGNRQWDIPELRTLLEKIVLHNHSLQDFEVENDFPVLGRRIMLLDACRLMPTDSRPELILLAIEDITERRRAEAQVREKEVRYRRLFETARDGILILDARTMQITDANPFIGELLGYSLQQFKGKELWEIGLFQNKQDSLAAIRKLRQKGYICYEISIKGAHGRVLEVELVCNLYQQDNHQVAQCNIRDITERKQLRRKIMKQAERLKAMDHRKDEFLAMLSHELRSPLAPLMSAAHLLRLEQENENPVQQQARAIIERQLGQLSYLLNDLLEVSRIITGRITLNKESVDVRAIIEHGVEAVRPLIDQRHHKLIMSQPPEPIWLYADAARLEQVAVNLLTNAAKYTSEGGHIWLTSVQEGDWLVLRVRDTGAGIAPELLPHIFDLFSQAERSLARSQGGLGVGLALVQRLVELHGGKVEVHSVMGQGSEFIVHLPVLHSGTHQSVSTSIETVEQPTQHSLRILVVDDNVDTADGFVILLRLSGHQARAAYSGSMALEAVDEYKPDVVLLDIGLPGIDGYEVARRIRQQPALKNIVLIAITGYGRKRDRQRSQGAGFDHHLIKPVEFGRIQQILATVKAT